MATAEHEIATAGSVLRHVWVLTLLFGAMSCWVGFGATKGQCRVDNPSQVGTAQRLRKWNYLGVSGEGTKGSPWPGTTTSAMAKTRSRAVRSASRSGA